MPTTTSPFGQLTLKPARFPRTGAKLARQARAWLSIFGFASLLMVGASASAQTLGAAQSFAVLGGTAVTAAAPPIIINGDVGIDPTAATGITGFPANVTIMPPFANHGNDGVSIAARASVTTLFNSPELAPAGGSAITPNLSIGGPSSSGTYGPGKYTLASGVATIPTTITLDGAGIYVFSLNSAITTSVGSTVVLINGANACSVFWRVPTLATLDGFSFPGTVVAGSGVHLGTNANLTGRALVAAAGDVTMAGGNTVGGCSGQQGLASTLLSTVASPSVALGGSISDTATLSGGISVPQGTITFNLYGPNDSTCSGNPIFTTTESVDDTGGYPSLPFTPTLIGTYRWIANYGGDDKNAATANACNAPNESVIVTGATSVTAIPTLSGWAMLALAGLMAVVGFVSMRRRMR